MDNVQLSETPDWKFMKKASEKLSFLFCKDDHWAPMHVFEEVRYELFFHFHFVNQFCWTNVVSSNTFAEEFIVHIVYDDRNREVQR